jgi:hypothetical protein
MDKHTKTTYKGTQHETTYLWSHDALKQMCDKHCKQWMQDNGYWERWVKPELGLNSYFEYTGEGGVLKTSQQYANRPVGDQLELMPHDSSLNWDVDQSNNMHVLFTVHLKRDDPRKFSKSCPLEIAKAILRLYNPVNGVVPKSHRIVQDIKRVLFCIEEIVKAGGAVVPGLVNRNGHRAKGAGIGRRYCPVRKNVVIPTLDEIGIFGEVQQVAKEFLDTERIRFQSKRQELEDVKDFD